MNEVKKLNEILIKHDAYSKVLTWDKNLKENDSIEWIIGEMFAAYQDEQLMILGIINKNYFEDNSVLFSIFKNPNSSDETLENELLDTMLKFSKENMEAQNVRIVSKISNKNKNSIIKTLRMKKYNKKGV